MLDTTTRTHAVAARPTTARGRRDVAARTTICSRNGATYAIMSSRTNNTTLSTSTNATVRASVSRLRHRFHKRRRTGASAIAISTLSSPLPNLLSDACDVMYSSPVRVAANRLRYQSYESAYAPKPDPKSVATTRTFTVTN